MHLKATCLSGKQRALLIAPHTEAVANNTAMTYNARHAGQCNYCASIPRRAAAVTNNLHLQATFLSGKQRALMLHTGALLPTVLLCRTKRVTLGPTAPKPYTQSAAQTPHRHSVSSASLLRYRRTPCINLAFENSKLQAIRHTIRAWLLPQHLPHFMPARWLQAARLYLPTHHATHMHKMTWHVTTMTRVFVFFCFFSLLFLIFFDFFAVEFVAKYKATAAWKHSCSGHSSNQHRSRISCTG
jgi:hypothetical protein